MIYGLLFYRFFLIGLFAIGGGATTIPFLFDLTTKYDWFSSDELIDMIAISESTPGPVGINMATFAGFQTASVKGAILATLGIITPSLLIIIMLSKLLNNFSCSKTLNEIFTFIRPAVLALILSATVQITQIGVQTKTAFFLLSLLLFLMFYFKKSPVFYILLSGLLGYFLEL